MRFSLVPNDDRDDGDAEAKERERLLSLMELSPDLRRALSHPVRRRFVCGLHDYKLAATIRELTSMPGLSRESLPSLAHHAEELVRHGAIEVVETAPVYRSLVANDPLVMAFLGVEGS